MTSFQILQLRRELEYLSENVLNTFVNVVALYQILIDGLMPSDESEDDICV